VRKQAIFDKALAFAQAGINIALAATKAASQTGIGAVVSVPLILALGALQLAAIASRPIPAAAEGLDYHTGGPLIAGERGTELMRFPGNHFAFTNNKATLYDAPRGTKVYPAHSDETVRALALAGLAPSRTDRQPIGEDNATKEIKALHKTLRNKPAHVIQGQIVGYQQNGNRVTYLNKMRNLA
jgi:hypothetical protein